MTATAFEVRTRHGDARRPALPVECTTLQSELRVGPEGLWRSEGGSLYLCDGCSLVCLSVHSGAFRGWVGKVAVRLLREAGGYWEAEQAFRNGLTGSLNEWRAVTLVVSEDRMTKYFDKAVPSAVLVYGHVENYYRVHIQ